MPNTSHNLNTINIYPRGEAYRNLDIDTLVHKAARNKEGVISKNGALTVTTGKYTGRSPKDRFIVDEPSTAKKIDWGKINVPFPQKYWDKLYRDITAYLSQRDEIYIFDGFAGTDPDYRLPVRVVNEFAYQNLFISQLLIKPNADDSTTGTGQYPAPAELTLLAAPGFKADPISHKTNSEAFIILNLEKRMVLIGGTRYCGEIKKSIFSFLNYLLPEKGVLPMHCAANIGHKNDVALFFGLSGTGKTSLSADPDRRLIGDDEHGWSPNGVFNIEAGCYAKCINLNPRDEPQIYQAIKHGATVENVVMDPCTLEHIFTDKSLTENTRAAYPLGHIPQCEISGKGGHPQTILFLTADAFGVLPPIAKLSDEQAVHYFLSGYTSKLAGTERGINEPEAVFSPFFGAPFMPCHPHIYTDLFKKYISRHHPNIFLINTGWTGGPYGKGHRIPIKKTRLMVAAALNGDLDKVKYAPDSTFKLNLPERCPGIEPKILNPRNTWGNKADYDKQARKLEKMFREPLKNIEL